MPELRRALGFRDLVLFYLATTFSLRWIATAAAAGPVALVFWVIAAACLFVPMVFTVVELSSRYPEEGGVYVWSKRAFGPFSAFMTGWMYWATNLPYFPGLLYFAAANALFVVPRPDDAVAVGQSVVFHRRRGAGDGCRRAQHRRVERRQWLRTRGQSRAGFRSRCSSRSGCIRGEVGSALRQYDRSLKPGTGLKIWSSCRPLPSRLAASKVRDDGRGLSTLAEPCRAP
jgi:hypothetical protein